MSLSTTEPSPLECGGDEPQLGKYFICAYPPFPCWSSNSVNEAECALEKSPGDAAEPFGLYLHIPFCVRRCDYCYYKSYAESTLAQRDEYLNFLDRELAIYRQAAALQGRPLRFLYFGGGTPSLLSRDQTSRLFDSVHRHFCSDGLEEVTFECAPDSVHGDKLDELKRCGVTRISLGVQQFDDRVLEANGRVHRVRSIERAYGEIRDRNFHTVNIDLMVGLVAETETTFLQSVDRAIDLEVDSVTIYQMEIPRNTSLYHMIKDARLNVPLADYEVKHARLTAAMERLTQAGYTLRSAYAAVRDPVRHHFIYQDAQYRGVDLLGLGVASFSYLSGIHFQNASTLDAYYETLANGRLPIQRAYALNPEEQALREFVLQLKLGEVPREYFRRKFGVDIVQHFAPGLQKLKQAGLIAWNVHSVRLTTLGLPRVDRMIREFYLPPHLAAAEAEGCSSCA